MSASFFAASAAAFVAAGGAALRFWGRRASPSPQTSSISDIHVVIAGDAGVGLSLLLPPTPSPAMDHVDLETPEPFEGIEVEAPEVPFEGIEVEALEVELEPAVEASRKSKAEEEVVEVVVDDGEDDEEVVEVVVDAAGDDEEVVEVVVDAAGDDEEVVEVVVDAAGDDEEGGESEPVPAVKDSSIAITQPRYEADTRKKSKDVCKGLEKRRELIPAWKSSTLAEKQKRAEEVRAYKADLQNQKKEQEEEGFRRLEALKRERDRRNAARISPLTPKQRRASLPPTIFASPLPNLSTRTCCSAESSRANDTSNGLSCSISSLAELKKEAADLSQIKRLAEPKGSNMHNAASGKPRKSASKESSKASGSKNSVTASSMQARKSDDSHVNDSPVLDPEKTVVMVESVDALAPPSPIVAHVSESELNVHLNPLYFLPEPGDF